MPRLRHYSSMVIKIRDENWIERSDKVVKPDPRRRVSLPKTLVSEGVMYKIYSNSMGQIMLDPQVTIPASELWLFQNKKALASIKRGFVDAAEGRVSKINLDDL